MREKYSAKKLQSSPYFLSVSKRYKKFWSFLLFIFKNIQAILKIIFWKPWENGQRTFWMLYICGKFRLSVGRVNGQQTILTWVRYNFISHIMHGILLPLALISPHKSNKYHEYLSLRDFFLPQITQIIKIFSFFDSLVLGVA